MKKIIKIDQERINSKLYFVLRLEDGSSSKVRLYPKDTYLFYFKELGYYDTVKIKMQEAEIFLESLADSSSLLFIQRLN